jgi:hypothetical protein
VTSVPRRSRFLSGAAKPSLGSSRRIPLDTLYPAASPAIWPDSTTSASRSRCFSRTSRIDGAVAGRDPDDARRLLHSILDRMVAAVQTSRVHRLPQLGDGIMALFGAPVAYEDHALRACYAALRMQESIGKYAEEFRRAEGFPLQIRWGSTRGGGRWRAWRRCGDDLFRHRPAGSSGRPDAAARDARHHPHGGHRPFT